MAHTDPVTVQTTHAVINDGETVGASPKAVFSTLAPIALGLALLLVDKLLVGDDIEDALWLGMLGAGPLAGAAAAVAKPGTVRRRTLRID